MSADTAKLIAQWRGLHFSQESDGKQIGDAIADALEAAEAQRDTLAAAAAFALDGWVKCHEFTPRARERLREALAAVEPPEEQP